MPEKKTETKPSESSEDLRARAERFLEKSGRGFESLPQKDIESLVHELQVHQAELEIQNEELRLAQAELEESRNQYFQLYDMAPVGYFTMDPKGLILGANLRFSDLLGLPRARFMKKPFSQFIRDRDRELFYSHMKRVFEETPFAVSEFQLITPGDKPTYVRIQSRPLKDNIQNVIHIQSVLIEITKQKEAELFSIRSEEKFRLMAETSLDIIFQLDLKGNLLYCSPSIENLGYTPNEVEGTPFERYVLPSHIPEARKNFRRLIFKRMTASFEVDVLSKSGMAFALEINAAPVIEGGKINYVMGVARDITGRKKAMEVLKTERARLETVLQQLPEGVIIAEAPSGKLLLGNEQVNRIWRQRFLSLQGIEDYSDYKGFHPDGTPLLSHEWPLARTITKGESVQQEEIRFQRGDGTFGWLLISSAPIRDAKENVVAGVATFSDISERKAIENQLKETRDQLEDRVEERTKELMELNRKLQEEIAKRAKFEEALKGSSQKIIAESKRRRFLSARLVETLERDRRDIGMYLHDQIGQMLATLKMDLEAMGKGNGKWDEQLTVAQDKLASIMGYVRDVSRNLRPDILDTLGLVSALRALIDRFKNETGLEIYFQCNEFSYSISNDKSLSLYRITQEALTNIAKHAQATEVFISLIVKEGFFHLSLEDNGIGFNYEEMINAETGEGPLGIMIMRERAALAGGELTVETQIGKGTHVLAEVPV